MQHVPLVPVVTEKSTDQQAKGQYTFYVPMSADKVSIEKSIVALYGLEVEKIRIIHLPRKSRQIGRGRDFQKRPNVKKAIVTTKDKKPLDTNKTVK